jgi:hypothetical protein
MKIEIKNRWNAKILFSVEAGSLKIALEIAVKKKADLRSATLSYADLRSADLRSADLSYANLSYADLSSANLSSADLRSADLRYANLSYADLRSADLRSATLSYANLRSADLRSADLRSAKGINKWLSTPLRMLYDQPGPIHAYKLVNSKGVGPFNGGIHYEMSETVTVADYDADENVQCSKGIHLATLDWCMKEWRKGYRILVAEFTADDIAAIPTATDGKFRVKKCQIVGEKDLCEIGLIESKKEEYVEAE